jgi:Rad3-related DNA helicase
MTEFGNMMVNYCRMIPGGVVIFFPSYTYMDHIHNTWKERGVVNRIMKLKNVFLESKNASGDEILQSYAKGVKNVFLNNCN